jgi:membrane-associated phospholipid phosphatase
MFQSNGEPVIQTWASAWSSNSFKKKLTFGLTSLILILAQFPYYFQFIEKRNGTRLNDWVLNQLPLHDASLPIFLILWTVGLLMIIRVTRDPNMLLILLWSYVLICLARILSILLVPLDPPAHLIPLADPITNVFYGPTYVTKDLFFSGHTSTVFLMFLCLKRKADKILAAVASLAVAVLLMIQRVHYSIDILGALLFTYLIYLVARKLIGNCGNRDKSDMERLQGVAKSKKKSA